MNVPNRFYVTLCKRGWRVCLKSKVIPCIAEHALYALHECRTCEEGGELGCSVVGWLCTVLACTCTVLLCVTLCMCGCPWILFHFTTGLHSCMCMSTACCNSLSLSSYHLPVPLAPLVDSLVTCQRLTSLGLIGVTLSLQSLLAVVEGLHNLRSLGLEEVQLLNVEDMSSSDKEDVSSSDKEDVFWSDEEDEGVSDWVWAAWTADNQLQHLKYSTCRTIVSSCTCLLQSDLQLEHAVQCVLCCSKACMHVVLKTASCFMCGWPFCHSTPIPAHLPYLRVPHFHRTLL